MNIGKEKQIKQLISEQENLNNEYERIKNSAIELATSNLLGKAGEELAAHLEGEGLAIEEKPNFSASTYEMIASDEYLNVRITRKPEILSVHMSNGEKYDVTIKSTNEPYIINVSKSLSQDDKISALKEGITQYKTAIQELNEDHISNYRYQVITEEYIRGDIRYPKKVYREFKEAIDMMFS